MGSIRTWTLLLCIVILGQGGLCAIKLIHQRGPTTNSRMPRYCAPSYSNYEELSSSSLKGIRNGLLDITKERFGHPQASEAMVNLFTKAVDTISELMADGNSSKLLDMTGKTGRFFSATTTSFGKLLDTVDEFLISTIDRFNDDLIEAKLKLVETTRETLSEFLRDLGEVGILSSLPDAEHETSELVHAEEIVIDKTKEAYQIVFDSTENTLREILNSNTISDPIKKLIAAKVLTSASNNLKSFGALRKRIYSVLSDVVDKKGNMTEIPELESFQDHLKNELLSITWNDDSTEDNDETDMPLTPQEEKELEDLLAD